MTTVRQLNVSGGELAPALYPRTDTSKFQAGFRTVRNMIVRKDGSLENRQGGEKKSNTRADKKTRLIEFRVTGEDSYHVELSHLKLRILRHGVPSGVPYMGTSEIVSITKANPGVLKFTPVYGIGNGDEVYVSGVPGMQEINGRTFIVTGYNFANSTFQLYDEQGNPVDTTTWGTFIASSSAVIQKNVVIDTEWTEDEIDEVDYDQSIDVMKLVQWNHEPKDLQRDVSDWYLIPTQFSSVPPSMLSGANLPAFGAGSGATGTVYYAITAITANGEETVDVNVTSTGNLNPTPTYFNQLGWNPDAAGITYYVYRRVDGVFGLIGSVVSQATGYQANMFKDVGVTPDTTRTIGGYYNPFNGAGNWPACVAYIQQRTAYGRTKNKPETVFMSMVGLYDKFIKRSPGDPIRDSDSIEFNLAGRSINPVHYLFDLNGMVMMTESSEQYLGNEAITPSSIRPSAQSYNGTKPGIKPAPMNNTLLYLQNLGSVIRELGFEYQVDGYRGDDLTTFSSHLFKNKQIVSWAYQQIPNSVLWVVRNDGTFITLTHVKEQQILAWTRHDVEGGFVEAVSCAREGTEDTVYLTVRRSVDGQERRFYERVPSRNLTHINDAKFMESHVTYDGTNRSVFAFVTIADPSNSWDYETVMNMTSNAPFFSASLVGKQIHVYDASGDVIRFTIDSYVNGSAVTGRPHKTVPVSLRNQAVNTFGIATNVVSNLDHLEGKEVSALGDGMVISSPHNSLNDNVVVVTNGKATFEKFYVHVTVGLPITADLETLNIDTVNGETMVDKMKQISKVILEVEETRGIFAGQKAPTGDDYLQGLDEVKPRFDESYEKPNSLITGKMDVIIQSQWNSNGRVLIRQVDPLPMGILSVSPDGLIPFNE